MNDQRRQGRIARRGGCRWLGFTFGLRTGGCLKRGKRAKERERTKAGESYGEILENDFMPVFLGPREQRRRDVHGTHLE